LKKKFPRKLRYLTKLHEQKRKKKAREEEMTKEKSSLLEDRGYGGIHPGVGSKEKGSLLVDTIEAMAEDIQEWEVRRRDPCGWVEAMAGYIREWEVRRVHK
jgi:hypothetical protein